MIAMVDVIENTVFIMFKRQLLNVKIPFLVGGDYLIEICGRHLNVYGQGGLRFIDKTWSTSKANDVNTVNFNYVNFNNIAGVLSKLKQRFPHVEHLIFKETNITSIGQLNAIAEVQGLTSLTIDKDGNPITSKEWESYAIYRLSHWGLKFVNGHEVINMIRFSPVHHFT